MRNRRGAALALVPVLAMALGLVAGCSGGPTEAGGPGTGASEAKRSAPESRVDGPLDSGSDRAPGTESAEGGARRDADSDARSSTNRARTAIRERAIVRTGEMRIQSKDPQATGEKVMALVSGTDGFVADHEATSSGSYQNVQVVLRVPVDRFDTVRASVRRLGKVLSDEQQAKDVTEDLVDTESRIATQKRSIEQLRTLLGRAKTVGEVIQVESELSERQAELESLQSRLAVLESQSALSTLTVRIEEPPQPREQREQEEELGFLAGLRGGWEALVETTQVALTLLGGILPFAVVVALLGGPPLWWYVRRRRRAATTAPVAPGPPPVGA